MNITRLSVLLLLPGSLLLTSCQAATYDIPENMMMTQSEKTETATFGSGCFWCSEAIFQLLKGVIKVEPGYSGGARANPTYEQVSSGATGHAEVIQVTYNPEIISFEELLEVFWSTHDPTTLNRQGADVGTQYRSVIFYHNEQQRQLAETYKARLDSSGAWRNPIVTEISPYKAFYPAESYHHDYFNRNSQAPYCTFVIVPKLDKFKKVFKEKVR
ncbi:Peptide methionine sulfoxide reductase MsrA [anaerobic digester metagenome]